ncbi:MAG: BrnT family toxin [Acidobacteriaceae bacterium]|nr:BrnT family toxin [Acidobacteriaceae bacterium]
MLRSCIYNTRYIARNWDDAKNAYNKRVHGISFETAMLVFDDPYSITSEDFIDDNAEVRYQTLGLIEGALVFVAHVYRVIDQVEQPWIISARKAVKNEEIHYVRRR